MSLWNKPIDTITLRDVEDFCDQGQPEGPRLDYKADVPKDLAKVVAAFANTTGGLIVLGVAADPKTNTPAWPTPQGGRGLPFTKGIEERLVAICQDNITPPVLPEVSRVFENPHLLGHALAVVRVGVSPEAPHAVVGYVYERTGSQGRPYDFAKIDRIEHLLGRRRGLEETREASIRTQIDRALHQLQGRRLHYIQPRGLYGPAEEAEYWMSVPLRWASVIPVYPWHDLCTPAECYGRHRAFSRATQVQRVPGGSFAIQCLSPAERKPLGRSSVTSRGHVFAIEWAHESEFNYEDSAKKVNGNRVAPENFWVSFDLAKEFVCQAFDEAAKFYGGVRGDLTGYLLLSAGFLDVRHHRMYRSPVGGEPSSDVHRGARFPDETFRADLTRTASEFLRASGDAAAELLDQVAYGFDLPPVPLSR
jgi:hypothetical protein